MSNAPQTFEKFDACVASLGRAGVVVHVDTGKSSNVLERAHYIHDNLKLLKAAFECVDCSETEVHDLVRDALDALDIVHEAVQKKSVESEL